MMKFLALAVALVAVSATPVHHQEPTVFLGTAANFAILSKAGISTVPDSKITGNIGVSPIAANGMTGFELEMHTDRKWSYSSQFTDPSFKAFAPDYVSPTPSDMTQAVYDMGVAYTDAAGRATDGGANLNVGAGLIAGKTFVAGVYTWGTDLKFATDITIQGNSTDVFIFQVSGAISTGDSAKVLLKANDGLETEGFPLAQNIFWQTAKDLTVGTSSHVEGIFLVKTQAVFNTLSSINGRIFSQTAVTLAKTTVTQPN